MPNGDPKITAPRILFLTADKHPSFRVDTVVLFTKELVGRLRYKVDWIMQSLHARTVAECIEWEGSRVWLAPADTRDGMLPRLRKRFQNYRNDLRALRLARQGDYDIIQARDRYFGGVIALCAAIRAGKPFVFWLSFPEPEASVYRAKNGMARYPLIYWVRGKLQALLLYKVLLKFARHAIVQSEQMKRDVSECGIDPAKLTVVPMGVDLDNFLQVQGGAGSVAIEAETIAYLGTLASERRIDFLVRVLALVVETHPNARLILVGGGDRPGDEEMITREADRLGVRANLIMTGRLPQQDALKRIRNAQVCVSPFFPTPILNSTSPTKLVEYMALSRPVVANDHPEQKLVIEQSRAGLCVPYEEKAFANAIRTLLDSPDECDRMGKRGLEYVLANRSYVQIADRLDRTYREILEA